MENSQDEKTGGLSQHKYVVTSARCLSFEYINSTVERAISDLQGIYIDNYRANLAAAQLKAGADADKFKSLVEDLAAVWLNKLKAVEFFSFSLRFLNNGAVYMNVEAPVFIAHDLLAVLNFKANYDKIFLSEVANVE